MAYAVAWNNAIPTAANAANLIWQYIQNTKIASQERLDDIFGTSAATGIETADPYRPIKFKLSGNANTMIVPGSATFAIRNAADTENSLLIDTVNDDVTLRRNLELGGQGYSLRATTTATTAATTIDLNTGNVHTLKLEANTVLTLNNPKDGATYLLEVVQDATGSRLITWPGTVEWASNSAPTLTTTVDKLDLISLYYNAVKAKYYGVIAGQNYDI